MGAPAIGTFIRPVGNYAYCYEVMRVIDEDRTSNEQWWCKRFGLSKDQQPVKDGHHDTHYLNGLKEVMPGVYRDEWKADTPRWSCCPLYYRQMKPKGQQQDLFS